MADDGEHIVSQGERQPMKGLARRLRAGRLLVHYRTGVEIVDASGAVIDRVEVERMAPSDWGIVYERWVGLELEKEGWEVDYRGLSLGLLDEGIDLVALQGPRTRYLQCKFLSQAIGKQDLEQILYKGSGFLSKQALSPDDVFELVVPSIDKAFPPKRKRNNQLQPNWQKIRFLSHNQTQNRIRLEITEIPMDLLGQEG
ncbi:hypothetical protein [Pseudomonas citronellolis]|uniref:hypothetical protein n=1 Tax=Pseudomonas citronellolis TaxID=53408 RepID=UPI0023E448EB|nr:hypothetical protein [Pseudomonas citronellolis]MDF3934335.1 hypothetical protein [Pseudomonas citronellolis]